MTTFSIPLPEVFQELGLEGSFEFDTDRANEGAYSNMVRQGQRYTASARMSHAAAKIRKEGREPTREDAQAVLDRLVADCYAEEWPSRVRAERSVRSLDAQVWDELLKAKFTAAGALRKANKKNGTEAVTVDTLLAQHGGPEQAFRAVFDTYVRGEYARAKRPITEATEATFASRADAAWAKLAADHAKELRARQRTAVKQVDPDAVSL